MPYKQNVTVLLYENLNCSRGFAIRCTSLDMTCIMYTLYAQGRKRCWRDRETKLASVLDMTYFFAFFIHFCVRFFFYTWLPNSSLPANTFEDEIANLTNCYKRSFFSKFLIAARVFALISKLFLTALSNFF